MSQSIFKTTYKRWNGTDWDIEYFETSADIVKTEDTGLNFVTDVQLSNIQTYLTTFNAANKLLKLDASGDIPIGHIPDLSGSYLTKDNPTFTGTLTGLNISAPADSNLTLKDAEGTHKIEVFKSAAMAFTSSDGFIFSGGNIAVGSKKITGLADPTDATDAVNKQYLEQVMVSGARPASNGPVQAASLIDQNVPLNGNTTAAYYLTIDEYNLANGDRVLLLDQETISENGIYTISISEPGTTYSLTKDITDSAPGVLVFVEHGVVHNDWTFYCNTDNTWAAFTKIDTIVPKDGLYRTGNEMGISSLGVTNAMLAGAIADSKLSDITPSQKASLGSAGIPISDGYLDHFSKLYTVIKNLKGTTNWNDATEYTLKQLSDNSRMNSLGYIAYAVATSNITTRSGTQTIDGISSDDGKVVVLLEQLTTSENGVYITDNATNWTKIDALQKNILYIADRTGGGNEGKVFIGNSATAATFWDSLTSEYLIGLTIHDIIEISAIA